MNLMAQPIQEKTQATIGEHRRIVIPQSLVVHTINGIMVQQKYSNTDFSKVRMYESQSAVRRGVQAHIDGYDIYFAPGAFQPHSASGRQIIEDILVELVRRMRAVEVTVIGMLSAPAACSARAAAVASPAN